VPSRLYQRSIEIILQHQDAGGAYPASPSFPTYRYCWLRDGSFTAYAMDLVGESASAQRFHDWTAQAVNARQDLVTRAIEKLGGGEPLNSGDYLHTRFTLSGEDSTDEDWPNHQLDGYGTWLWALREHSLRSHQPLPPSWRRASDAVAAYLSALWSLPCYDCWEEFPNRVHSYTLGAVYAGLRAHAALSAVNHTSTVQAIRSVLLAQSPHEGRFVKYLGGDQVDASLIGLAVPYALVPPNDPRMRATIDRIEGALRSSEGVHRYAQDTYYGGGEWVLLTAWLGWYYAVVGEQARASEALRWVEAQADVHGQLPEQVPASLIDASQYNPWRQRWGEIARPLLWSHANHLILCQALGAT
jgi:GH15 family glucan-1,4-alpha-glucosidase